MNVEQIVKDAIAKGVAAANVTDDKDSNGSEAWQYVTIPTKGLRKLQNELKKLPEVQKDSYYGYIIETDAGVPNESYGYYKGDAFTHAVAKHLTENGITAHARDRLL